MSSVAVLLAVAKANAIANGKVLRYADGDASSLNVPDLKQKFFELLDSWTDISTSSRLSRLRRWLRWLKSDDLEELLWYLAEPVRSDAVDVADWLVQILEEIVEDTKKLLAEERAAARQTEEEEDRADSIASRVVAWRTPSSRRPGGIAYVPPDPRPVLGHHLGSPYRDFDELQVLLQASHRETVDPDEWIPARTIVTDWMPLDRVSTLKCFLYHSQVGSWC